MKRILLAILLALAIALPLPLCACNEAPAVEINQTFTLSPDATNDNGEGIPLPSEQTVPSTENPTAGE